VFQPRTIFSTPASQGLQVWFDYPYFLEAGPCEYQLIVHAKTSNGLWITNLHWDFGDGSTLDVPFTWQSVVTDSRTHGYANAGTYTVSVTAYDSAGNSYIGYWGLYDAFPTSCIREPGTTAGPTSVILNVVFQNNLIRLKSFQV
jgi:PKD repeat protein